mgnify:CR=1 FL=1
MGKLGISPLLLLGGIGLMVYLKQKKPSETSQIIASPTGQDALSNISAVYSPGFAQGVSNAVQTSTTTREALSKIAILNTGPPIATTQDLVKQTSLKAGGGGTGLANGSYKISGLKSPVTVKSVAKKDSIAYKKGYIK